MNMKVAINPFLEGKDIIAKAQKLVTNFPYGSERYKNLWKLANEMSGAHGECVKLCLYLNGTRISARQSILYFIGINIFGLKSYTMPGNTHGVEDWKSEEWETLFEMEDVLNCTKILTTQANYETAFTSAFRPLIQHTLINSIY